MSEYWDQSTIYAVITVINEIDKMAQYLYKNLDYILQDYSLDYTYVSRYILMITYIYAEINIMLSKFKYNLYINKLTNSERYVIIKGYNLNKLMKYNNDITYTVHNITKYNFKASKPDIYQQLINKYLRKLKNFNRRQKFMLHNKIAMVIMEYPNIYKEKFDNYAFYDYRVGIKKRSKKLNELMKIIINKRNLQSYKINNNTDLYPIYDDVYYFKHN